MTCKLCKLRGQTWNGSPPNCAFDKNAVFDKDNWNCATMNALRQISRSLDTHMRYNDESIGYIPLYDFGFIVLTWYKDRGRTGNAIMICDDEEPLELTYEQSILAISRFRDKLTDSYKSLINKESK